MKKNTGVKYLLLRVTVEMQSENAETIKTFCLSEYWKGEVGSIFEENPDQIRTRFVLSGNEEAHRNALVDILRLYIDDVQNDILRTFVEKFSVDVEDEDYRVLDGGYWNEGASVPLKDPKKVYGLYIFKKGGAGMEVDGKFYTCNPDDGEYFCMIIRGDLEFKHFLEKGKKKEFIHLVTYTE